MRAVEQMRRLPSTGLDLAAEVVAHAEITGRLDSRVSSRVEGIRDYLVYFAHSSSSSATARSIPATFADCCALGYRPCR